jgi:anti-sigma B factor antagonist
MAIQDNDSQGEPSFTDATTDVDESFLVSFSGELDISTAGEIRERLARPEVLDAPVLHVDLTEATFIDSSAIGLLVSACKRIRGSGGTFSVRCDAGPVRRTLEISGLIDYLEVHDATASRSQLGCRR